MLLIILLLGGGGCAGRWTDWSRWRRLLSPLAASASGMWNVALVARRLGFLGSL